MAFGFKPWLGVLLAAYAVYFWRELSRDESDEGEEFLEPLIIRPQFKGVIRR